MTSVEPVSRTDYDDLAAFLSGFQDDSRSEASWQRRFTLWWDDNPAFSSDTPRGFVLRDDGRIVGFRACLPLLFQLHGDPVTVFSGSTWRVEEKFRGDSLKLLLPLMTAASDTVLFAATPTVHVAKIYDSLGFTKLETDECGSSVDLIHAGKVCVSRLETLGPARHVGWLIGPLIRVVQAIRTSRLSTGRFDVRELDHASDEFDDLWQRTRGQYANTIVRTARIVNWHCFHRDPHRKRLVGCYDGTRLVGFAICQQRESRGVKLLLCVDLWVDETVSGVVAALASGVRDLARRGDCDALHVSHFNASIAENLKHTGLFKTKAASHRRYFKTSPAIGKRLMDETKYYTYLVGDFGL